MFFRSFRSLLELGALMKIKKKNHVQRTQYRSFTNICNTVLPCEKKIAFVRTYEFPSSLVVQLPWPPRFLPSIYHASIFQYPAYFGLLAKIRISISISCGASYFFFLFWFWFVFFSMPSFCNSLSGISARMKRGMHRAHLRCGPYNNVFLLHVGRIVPALTHLAPHPYPYPLSLRLKKNLLARALFHFHVPAAHPEQLLLIWRSKESPLHAELIYRDGYLWNAIIRLVTLDFYH